MTQNCIPIRATRLKNCVYIVAPTHVECVVLMSRVEKNELKKYRKQRISESWDCLDNGSGSRLFCV